MEKYDNPLEHGIAYLQTDAVGVFIFFLLFCSCVFLKVCEVMFSHIFSRKQQLSDLKILEASNSMKWRFPKSWG